MTRLRPALSRQTYIGVLIGALALLSLWCWRTVLVWPAPGITTRIPWEAFAAAFIATDLARFRIEFREQGHDLDLFELALVPALVFCAPTWLLVARLVALAISLEVVRRQAPIKFLFNAAQGSLRVGVAVLVAHTLGLSSNSPVSGRAWIALLAACAASELVSRVSVVTVIWMAAGRPAASELVELAIAGPLLMFTATTLGLVCVAVLWANPWGIWMLVVVGAIAAAVHRVHHQLRRRYANLRILNRFTRDVSEAGSGTALVAIVLNQAREILNAEWAELLVRNGTGVSRTIYGPDGVAEELAPLGTRSGWLLSMEKAARLGNQDAERLGAADGHVDVLVSPLGGHEGLPEAVILVGNRLGDATHFDDEDLELASTLAGAAGLALRNGRLVDALRQQAETSDFQAHHDSLTSLANRAMFLDATTSGLSALGTDGLLAVMLVDLDNFKDVNDTLGHHFGDRLLCEVAHRLTDSLGDRAVVARLGGDEFAVLLASVTEMARIEEAQAEIHACLGRPFLLEELSLQVRASIGVALAPHHALDATGLLRSADIAMYMAKSKRSGTQMYEAEADQNSRRRLALGVELSQALAEGQFELHYQPQAELVSGQVVAVEALVRWNHPRYGLIAPDEFIGLAEQSGTIAELTRWVLRSGLADQARWLALGFEVDISLNISPRNLLDARLTEDLAKLYAEYATDPSRVTLEVTEGGVMADPEQAATMLGRLALGGTRISIDDFGTGHSSLARLTHLPVSEIKIDRSFVDRMTVDSRDRAIVEATIQLSRTLNLSVVAEGIEDPFTWKVLAELGCQLGQGYHLARPLRYADLLRFLEARNGAEDAGPRLLAGDTQT